MKSRPTSLKIIQMLENNSYFQGIAHSFTPQAKEQEQSQKNLFDTEKYMKIIECVSVTKLLLFDNILPFMNEV